MSPTFLSNSLPSASPQTRTLQDFNIKKTKLICLPKGHTAFLYWLDPLLADLHIPPPSWNRHSLLQLLPFLCQINEVSGASFFYVTHHIQVYLNPNPCPASFAVPPAAHTLHSVALPKPRTQKRTTTTLLSLRPALSISLELPQALSAWGLVPEGIPQLSSEIEALILWPNCTFSGPEKYPIYAHRESCRWYSEPTALVISQLFVLAPFLFHCIQKASGLLSVTKHFDKNLKDHQLHHLDVLKTSISSIHFSQVLRAWSSHKHLLRSKILIWVFIKIEKLNLTPI